MTLLNELKNKNVLILGFGREGVDNFRFLRKLFPDKVFGVGDRLKIENFKLQIANLIRRDKNIRLHLGDNYLKALKNYDVIIKSPGVPPKVIAPFLTKKQKVTSQTEIFFENCPGKIVGITGTKGKSTTATLIYKILKRGGIKVHLIGNIGRPVLSLLFSATPNDVYISELSSHQLFNLKRSPQIAVFLNLFADHLDYYKNLKEYIKAKANITKYQTKEDFLVYNSGNEWVRKIAKNSKAQKIPIPTNIRISTNIRIPLIGEFNLQNIMAAVTVGKFFRIPRRKIIKAIKNFKPLPHRLEFIGNFKGIKFYNDTQATVPEATISAIEAFANNVQTIILGGSEKNVSFKNLAKKVLESKIKTVILFPTTGERIWKEILREAKNYSKRKLPKHFFANNMKEAVGISYQNTKKGGICLLSPACASFSLFKNYKERGNLFKKYVKKYGQR